MSPDLLSGRPTCTTLSVLSGDDQNSWAVTISTAASQGNDFWGKMVPSWLQVADKESGWTDRGREGPFSTHAGSYLKHNTPSGLFLRLYSQTVSLRWCLSCCPVSWPAFKHRPKYIFRDFREDTLYKAHKIMLHKLQGYETICEIKSRHHIQDMRPGVSEHLIASRSH